MKVQLDCSDFSGWCCASCHEDAESHGYDMIWRSGWLDDIPPNRRGRPSKTEFEICYSIALWDLSRTRVAQLLWAKRKKVRNETST